jgi:hypothetical protein
MIPGMAAMANDEGLTSLVYTLWGRFYPLMDNFDS